MPVLAFKPMVLHITSKVRILIQHNKNKYKLYLKFSYELSGLHTVDVHKKCMDCTFPKDRNVDETGKKRSDCLLKAPLTITSLLAQILLLFLSVKMAYPSEGAMDEG